MHVGLQRVNNFKITAPTSPEIFDSVAVHGREIYSFFLELFNDLHNRRRRAVQIDMTAQIKRSTRADGWALKILSTWQRGEKSLQRIELRPSSP
jgi:hypothetical protein